MALPVTPDELTPAWLSLALGAAVTETVVDEVIWGTTTKVFVRVTYDGDGARGVLPSSVCVKGLFTEGPDEERLPARVFGAVREATFFVNLAPQLDVPLFRTHFADVDEGNGQGIVIFDDLRTASGMFGRESVPSSPDGVASALEAQARWHGAMWGTPVDRYLWLRPGNEVVRAASEVLFTTEHWRQQFGRDVSASVPDEFAGRDRIVNGFRALWEFDSGCALTLSHGDPHIGNTYRDDRGAVIFFDWQTFCLAPYIDDVTYYLGGALSIEDRRAHETDLLQHYLGALAAAGGPTVSFDEAWLGYRRHHLHGFFWALMPPEWNPLENSVPMAERYIAAMQDHDSLAALGV
jgi:hypothetical protein